MSLNIAVDCGHGFTKGIAATGPRILFPSLIAPAPTGPHLGRFSPADVVAVNGQPYLVGESARLNATSLFSHEKATDPLTLALTWIACANVVGPGYRTVSLAVGLPLSWYAAQQESLAAALRGVVDVDGSHLLVDAVTVFPQGIGALLAADLPRQGLVGLVDIGYRTVDYLIAQVQDGMPSPLLDRSGTWQGGLHVAYQSMSQSLEKFTAVRFEPHELVDREAITANGQRVPLEPYRAVAFQALAADLSRHLAAQWDGIGEKLDTWLLAGGGALALAPYWSGLTAPTLLSDSQWANARGYLNLLE